MAMHKKFGAEYERAHPRDGSLSISNPNRALHTLLGCHRRKQRGKKNRNTCFKSVNCKITVIKDDKIKRTLHRSHSGWHVKDRLGKKTEGGRKKKTMK